MARGTLRILGPLPGVAKLDHNWVCSINDPAHSRVEGRPGLFSPFTSIGGYGDSRPQWRQGQNPTARQAPVQPQGLVIWDTGLPYMGL